MQLASVKFSKLGIIRHTRHKAAADNAPV